VFVVLKGPRRGLPLSAEGLDEILAGARRRAGLEHATCHQLRHTCLTRLPGRSRTGPDGTERLDLPADAHPVRRQRPRRPRPPQLRPHHGRQHLTPAMTPEGIAQRVSELEAACIPVPRGFG
jgi:hypothetical protein